MILMPDRETLLALAERCEAAEGPSYELDCAIWDAIYPGERDLRFGKLTAKGQPYHSRLGPADKDGYVQPLRAFTASIDAAVTLVPEGWGWAVTNIGGGDYEKRDFSVSSAALCDKDGNRINADASTPALALCAASLRAMAGEGK